MEQSDSNQYFMDMFLEYFNNFLTYEYFAEYGSTIAKSIASATVKPKPCAPVIDEDALYIQYNMREAKI